MRCRSSVARTAASRTPRAPEQIAFAKQGDPLYSRGASRRGSKIQRGGMHVTRMLASLLALMALAFCITTVVASASAADDTDVLVFPKEIQGDDDEDADVGISGAADFRDVSLGTGLTECPQAGDPLDKQPKPLDRRSKDKAEQLSNGGDDNRTNQDYSCF